MPFPDWYFDEFARRGTDYGSESEVRDHDQRMSMLRDAGMEARAVIGAIKMKSDHVVLELGAETGEFALEAARHCGMVVAADVSSAMLECARRKALERRILNVEFVRAGFLSYEHAGRPLDAVVSTLALHHLPDFWKLVGLTRVSAMLKEGGRFYLKDVVYSLPVERVNESIEEWIRGIGAGAGATMARQARVHVRDEYSTYEWIMEEMLYRAGFYIESAEYNEEFLAEYVCIKTPARGRA